MFVDSTLNKVLTDFHAPIITPNRHFVCCIVAKFLHQLSPFPLTKSFLQVYLLLLSFALADTLRAELHPLVDARLK